MIKRYHPGAARPGAGPPHLRRRLRDQASYHSGIHKGRFSKAGLNNLCVSLVHL